MQIGQHRSVLRKLIRDTQRGGRVTSKVDVCSHKSRDAARDCFWILLNPFEIAVNKLMVPPFDSIVTDSFVTQESSKHTVTLNLHRKLRARLDQLRPSFLPPDIASPKDCRGGVPSLPPSRFRFLAGDFSHALSCCWPPAAKFAQVGYCSLDVLNCKVELCQAPQAAYRTLQGHFAFLSL